MDQEEWLSKLLFALLLALLIACSPATETPISSSTSTPFAEPTSTPVAEPTSTDPEPTPDEPPPELPGSIPDLIFHNGVLLTMEQGRPQVQAIAILGDKILAAGSDEEILALNGTGTQVIDLGGRTLLPGFIDSHGHWIGDIELTEFSTVDETIQYLLENGWTSINEMFVSQDRLEELLSFDREGRLRVRVNAYLPVNYMDQRFGHPYLNYTPGEVLSPNVRVAGVKLFVDNDWGHIINWEQDELNAMVLAIHQAGWQAALHTFSVQGHMMTLEALDYALRGEDNSEYRHRIEHIVIITDDQLAEVQQQGYIASIQLNIPGNIPQADPTFNDKVSAEHLPLVNRWGDIYKAGITLVGSTDWPWFTNNTFLEGEGAPAGSPIRLLYKAVTHIGAENRAPDDWMRDQFLPVDVALQTLTINGAYATFEEDVKGSLAPGKWADIVILSDNPLTVSVDALKEIKVLVAMIGGNVEYCAEGAEALCGQAAYSSEAMEGAIVVQQGSAIEIAVQGPATGQLAGYYPHMWNMAQMAVTDYGLVLGEFPITLVQIDDRCDQSAGASAAEQLLTDHPQVVGVIGPLCSAAAMGSLPVFQEAGLVSVSGSATRESLSALFGAGGFNRTVLHEQQLDELGLTENSINERASVQAFYTRYEEQYGPLPAEIRPLMAYTYDAVQVLLHAIENAATMNEDGGLSMMRPVLAEAVRYTQGFTGLTGPIAFGENGDRIPVEVLEE